MKQQNGSEGTYESFKRHISLPLCFEVRNKREYKRTSNEMRLRLLAMINCDQVSIKLAAKTIGINYSTAKNIVKMCARKDKNDKFLGFTKKDHESVSKKTEEFLIKKLPLPESFLDCECKLPEDVNRSMIYDPAVLSKNLLGNCPKFDFSMYASQIYSYYMTNQPKTPKVINS